MEDEELKARLAELYAACREREYADVATVAWRTAPGTQGTQGTTQGTQNTQEAAQRAETLGRIRRSGDHFVEHFTEIPLLLFVFSIDDHGGANIYPAIWSAMLAARAQGIGAVPTTMLRYEHDAVLELLGVPREAPCTRWPHTTSGARPSGRAFPNRCGPRARTTDTDNRKQQPRALLKSAKPP